MTFTVTNTGQTTARNLAAAINLPADVFLDTLEVPGDWTCAPLPGSNKTAECTLPSLAPGAMSTIQVAVFASGKGAAGREIVATVWADGLTRVTATTTIAMVTPNLVFSPTVSTDLSSGGTGPSPSG